MTILGYRVDATRVSLPRLTQHFAANEVNRRQGYPKTIAIERVLYGW